MDEYERFMSRAPGTWLRRLVTRAHVLGFTTITARGFDVARVQVQRARLLARDLCGISGVNLTFDVTDLTGELPEVDASADLTLCLYSVLSHLPVAMGGSLCGISGVNLTFDVADLTGELPEADASADLTLCLYSVLSHLPVASLPKISAEVARVTSGHFITTVRSVGSTPTIFVDSIEKGRHFKHDNSRDQCEIELCEAAKSC
jgi:hypothetical protein